MAKRRGRPRRAVSIDGLVATLKSLDQQREAVTARLKSALNSALSGVSSTFSTVSTGTYRRGRPPGTAKGTRKRRKMSAAARAKIAAAQRARWAKQKAGK
jgi:hypothetical protein